MWPTSVVMIPLTRSVDIGICGAAARLVVDLSVTSLYCLCCLSDTAAVLRGGGE